MSVEAIKVLISKDGKGGYSEVTTGQEPNFGRMIRYDLRNHEFIFGNILPNPKCVDVTCRALRRKQK
jgi:hypothetical protein